MHQNFRDCDLIRKTIKDIEDYYLYTETKKNKIDSIAASALIDCFGKENINSQWLDSFKNTETKIAQYMEELERVAKLFHNEDIKLIALKNSGITKGIYTNFAESPMGDLDVLVRKEDFIKGHQILIKNGYQMKFRSALEKNDINDALRNGGSEYLTILPSGKKLWFELQWRPVSGRWINSKQEPSAEDLILRSKKIPNSFVRVLSSEDNLVQVCLHTAKHSYIRSPGFRLHTDVDRIVRESNVDWKLFENMVILLNIKTATFFSLKLSRDLLRTPIPNYIISKLKPPKWKQVIIENWLMRLGLFYPEEKKWSKLGFILFVILLYDNFSDLRVNIFPRKEWMQQRYNFKSPFILPFAYLYRIYNLIAKRKLNR